MKPVEEWDKEYQPKELRLGMRLRRIDRERIDKLRTKMSRYGKPKVAEAVVVRAAIKALHDAAQNGVTLKGLILLLRKSKR